MTIIVLIMVFLLALVLVVVVRHDWLLKSEGLSEIGRFGNSISELYCRDDVLKFIDEFSRKNNARVKGRLIGNGGCGGVIKSNDGRWFIHYKIVREVEGNVFHSRIFYRFPKRSAMNFDEAHGSRHHKRYMVEAIKRHGSRMNV